jgi:hypothetical protein
VAQGTCTSPGVTHRCDGLLLSATALCLSVRACVHLRVCTTYMYIPVCVQHLGLLALLPRFVSVLTSEDVGGTHGQPLRDTVLALEEEEVMEKLTLPRLPLKKVRESIEELRRHFAREARLPVAALPVRVLGSSLYRCVL